MITIKVLRKFLALERFRELCHAMREQAVVSPPATLGSARIFLAILLSLLPAISGTLGSLPSKVDLTTVSIGTAAVLAVIFRLRTGIVFHSVTSWRHSLRLTHSAFALGCIPAVMILVLHPQALYLLTQPSTQEVANGPSIPWWLFVLQVAVWAGLTEELIYRGLLISILRRWSAFKTQLPRDIFAITLSSLIFGLGHLSSWGPGMSIALVGLGAGLGLAYVAIGERLLPVIVYHILFDILSLTFALFSYRG